MKKLITHDPAFTTEEGKKAFRSETNGFDWHYNISTNTFGYGDDARDWEQYGDNYIDSSKIESINEGGEADSWEIWYEE